MTDYINEPKLSQQIQAFCFFGHRKAIARDRRAVSWYQSISMQKRRNKPIVAIEILRFAQDDRSDTPRGRLHKRTQTISTNPRVLFFWTPHMKPLRGIAEEWLESAKDGRMPNAKKRRNQPIGGRGASPPSGEDALRLSPVCHSGRNPNSDRMRRPPSLAGSERGELQKCKNKPIRQVSNDRS